MKLLKCLLTDSGCYRAGRTIVPKGVMIHSTGANNPMLRRYVQPSRGDADYENLRSRLGVNPNGNHWNRPGVNACVHAFIGRLADGRVAAVQTLPWNRRGWHAGGKANGTHIAFEICEDGLTDAAYFAEVYRAAVELTAHLCELYRLDPLEPGVILCHSEGHSLGVASNHGDVEHWFPKFGKNMDEFRADVAAELEKGREEMTQEQFNEMMDRWLALREAEPASGWSEKERAWMEKMGLLRGDEAGNMHYKSFCTREELAVIIYRLEHPED